MIVFVTGATGHLGNVLVRTLLSQGHEVRVLLRKPAPLSLVGLGVEPIYGDLFDREALGRGCQGARWVFHCAALISTLNRDLKEVERVNVVGTRNMIEAALDAKVERFIYVSSVEALDLLDPGAAIGPDHFSSDRNVMGYGRTKANATLEVLAAVRQRGLPGVVGIPSAIIGPYDFGSSRTVEMVRLFLARRIPAYIDGGFDFVDVRDVAGGLVSAAHQGAIGGCYLLTGELLSYFQITELLERISGVPMSHMKAPYWLALPFTYLATALGSLT
ncbi:MAG TPA: NAD-dependent epimerase/dehydratase family protein, partial [Spirochaetia bacterium]|nr:NAD-dependent epimerase/dehydratase family protein [Spirochaetia bacterium]